MIATTGRVWEAAGTDPSRPVLMGVYFDAKNGTLAATDSYVMARVPCEVEDGDESGIIPAAALKEAKGQSLRVSKGKVTLKLDDGERTWKLIEGTFPDCDKILRGAESAEAPVGLNPDLLKKLATAIGWRGSAAAVLHPTHPRKALRLAIDGMDGGEGLLMPMVLRGRTPRRDEPVAKAPDLSDDERVVAAVRAAAAALDARRGKKRAAETFRKALTA